LTVIIDRYILRIETHTKGLTMKFTIGPEGCKKLQEIAKIHGHESVERVISDAVGFWKAVGEQIEAGAVFTIVFPDGRELLLDLPYKYETGDNRPRLRIVVDNTQDSEP